VTPPEAEYINYIRHVGYVYIILLSTNNGGSGVGEGSVSGDVSEKTSYTVLLLLYYY